MELDRCTNKDTLTFQNKNTKGAKRKALASDVDERDIPEGSVS